MVNKIFIDHPELYKYFFENVRIQKDDPNYDRVRRMASLMLDYFDTSKAVAASASTHFPAAFAVDGICRPKPEFKDASHSPAFKARLQAPDEKCRA
jgi:hypothetical protein